jgi:lipopolysaccharide export system protein LptA
LVFVICLPALAIAQEDAPDLEMEDTIFTGDFLEMISGDEVSEFHLLGNVTVLGTNLHMTSDELHIKAIKKGDKDATIAEMGKITEFLAIGNVHIEQSGRTAEAGRAELFPEDKTVVLTENPVVTDQQGTVSGTKVTWSHGDRRAKVEGTVKVVLGAIPNSGFDPDKKGEEDKKAPSESPANSADNSPANP